MGDYTQASVCRRGHTYTDDIRRMPPAQRCDECGAALLSTCPACSTPIRGEYVVPGVVGFSGYEPPNFCFSCGAPFPWATRQARIWELQNVLDEQELDEATRLTVAEQLEALQDPELDQDEQLARWEKVRALAPGVLTTGQRVVESVMTAWVKGQMGL